MDEFAVECDICGITESHEKDLTAQYGEDNGFAAMIETLKEEGWSISKSDETGQWLHICPGCILHQED